MARAAESTHWYDRDGTPCYEVMGKNGKMRPATLADARKFGWYPGVTSIIRCAAAPALQTWKEKQVMLAALTLPRLNGELDDDFCKRVIADSQEHAKEAREQGTEIHAAIQGHFEGKAPDEEMWPFVKGVVTRIKKVFNEQNWRAEKACSHESGFGTKADLFSGAALIDFKSKDFVESDILETYDEHHMQLAATRMALNAPLAKCAICYVSRTVPGLAYICIVEEEKLIQGWQMFQGLLSYWQAKNNYFPIGREERKVA